MELGIGFIVGLAVARALGPTQFGVLALGYILVGIAQRAAQSGLWAPLCKRANDADIETWETAARTILKQRSWFWTAILTTIILILPIGPLQPHKLELILLALAIPGNTGECKAWILTARLKSKLNIFAERCAQIITGIYQIILVILLLFFFSNSTEGKSIIFTLFALALPLNAWSRTLILNRISQKKEGEEGADGNGTGRPDLEKMKTILSEGTGTRASVVIQFVCQNTPTLIAGLITPAASGLISAAIRIRSITQLPAELILQNNCPQIVKTGDWKPTLWRVIANGTVCIALIPFAPKMVTWLYGEAYQSAGYALQWLLISVPAALLVTLLESQTLHLKTDQIDRVKHLQKPAVLSLLIALITTSAVAYLNLNLNPNKMDPAKIAALTGMFLTIQCSIHAFCLGTQLFIDFSRKSKKKDA